MTTKGIDEHLKAFQSHGDLNGGNRAGGSPGYEASADYVTARLERKGYTVTDDFFDFVYNADRTPPLLTVQAGKDYVDGNDFASMTFSPNGDVTAQVVAVDLIDPTGQPDNTSSSGCQASDFAGFPAGAIALVQRGNPTGTTPPCTFAQKAQFAADAGVGRDRHERGQQRRAAGCDPGHAGRHRAVQHPGRRGDVRSGPGSDE